MKMSTAMGSTAPYCSLPTGAAHGWTERADAAHAAAAQAGAIAPAWLRQVAHVAASAIAQAPLTAAKHGIAASGSPPRPELSLV